MDKEGTQLCQPCLQYYIIRYRRISSKISSAFCRPFAVAMALPSAATALAFISALWCFPSCGLGTGNGPAAGCCRAGDSGNMAGLAGLCAPTPPGHEPRCRLSSALSDGAPKMEDPVESIRLTVMPAAGWSAPV